jgi:hypothetical protein
MLRKHKTLEERLSLKIIKGESDQCWPWTGGTVPKGYGTIKKCIGNTWKTVYAHREILRLSKGEPTNTNDQALHSCDNPSCCNPSHLRWGTESQNRREARDRLHNQGNQKLKPEQVVLILIDQRTNRLIAAEYAVHHDTIARIKQGRSWQP